MKVGMISFHNAYNYGACLQAYALQEALADMGVECEYIDYVNKRRAEGYKVTRRVAEAFRERDVKGIVKNLCGAPFLWLRRRRFDRFYAANLRKTARVYHDSQEAGTLNGEYDKFIVGSDQVWNAEHNGTDAAYFLDFVDDDSKKISYSSSFGVSEIPEALKAWYAEHLKRIACLSTREKHGVDIIEELTGRRAHLVLDPVFLLEADAWRKLIDEKASDGAYTFYYINADFNPDDFGIVTGWKDREKRILSAKVTPGDFIKRDRKVTFSMTPEAFLRQIHDARLVVTTSFHGLAFSILFHKPFVAVLSGDEGRDERLLNLLRITGLEERIFSGDMTLEAVEAPIDYAEADRRLDVYRSYSRAFLRAAVYEGPEAADAVPEPPYVGSASDGKAICEFDQCTGCGACSVKCPKQAIEMRPDAEGFLRPWIDEGRCVNCGICNKVCPANNPKRGVEAQAYFAMKHSDTVRAKCSSGGAFRALAAEMIARGGVVVASEMNDQWQASHTVAKTMEQVDRQGRTYYVQGKAFVQFEKVEALLKSGCEVLFEGTPCQVGGLKRYLGRDYDGLITCDILCHGIPSPKLFEIYVRYLNGRGALTELKQRDKEIGWRGYCVSATIAGKKYKNAGWLKAYGVMFSHGLINRTSCYRCAYANYDRPADITIGDYWGIEKHHREMMDKLGVSLVLTNSEKGRRFFEKAAGNVEYHELRKEETIQNSLSRPGKRPKLRASCIREMERSYDSAARKYGEWNPVGYAKEFVRSALLKVR